MVVAAGGGVKGAPPSRALPAVDRSFEWRRGFAGRGRPGAVNCRWSCPRPGGRCLPHGPARGGWGQGRTRRAITVDGKALKGSAHLAATHRRLLSAVTHRRGATLVQAEAGPVMGLSRYSAKPLVSVVERSLRTGTGCCRPGGQGSMMLVGQMVRGMTGRAGGRSRRGGPDG